MCGYPLQLYRTRRGQLSLATPDRQGCSHQFHSLYFSGGTALGSIRAIILSLFEILKSQGVFWGVSHTGEDVLTLNALTTDHIALQELDGLPVSHSLEVPDLSPVLARCRLSCPRTFTLGVHLGLCHTEL